MVQLKPLMQWMVPWALVAGITLTLLSLGAMHWEQLQGCGQRNSPPYGAYSPSGGCATLAEGYPVRFLSTQPELDADPGTGAGQVGVGGVPVINKVGLAEDWLIWSIVSCSAIYVVCRRRPALSARDPEGAQEQSPAGA